MNEEYGSGLGFVRQTDGVASARQGQKPRKVKETGKSFSSLLDNIRYGRLGTCIKKYNEEYARLYELAVEVDKQRVAVDKGEMSYAEVRDTIDEYNEQARRLADIGVRVFAFDEQAMQKLRFTKEEVAKGIKVPAFLIGPLKRLSRAGREKARLEQEARLEKEAVIYDAIVQRAEEALGQNDDSIIDAKKFESLDSSNLSQGVMSQLSEEKEKQNSSGNEAVDEEQRAREEAEKLAQKEAEEQARKKAEEKVAAKRKASDEIIKKIYEKSPNAAKKRKETAKANKAIVSGDVFEILAELDKNFCICKVKSKDGLSTVEMLATKGEKERVLKLGEFAKMTGITDKKEIVSAYGATKDSVKVANLWSRVAAKSYTLNYSNGDVEVHKSDGTVSRSNNGEKVADEEEAKLVSTSVGGSFDEDRKALFTFVSDSIKSGMSEKEIVSRANEIFSVDEVVVINSFVHGNLEIIKKGIAEVEASLQQDDKLEEKKRQVLDEALAKRATAKYGHPVIPVTSEEQESPENDAKSVDEEDKSEEREEENKEVVSSADNDGYVSKIGVLAAEIAELSKSRDGLRKALGDEAKTSVEKINECISSKLDEINKLALGEIVPLGKQDEGKSKVSKTEEETPVVHEEDGGQSDGDLDEAEEDEKERDTRAWWSMMLPILDSPDQQLLSRLEVAKFERAKAGEAAKRKIEEDKWKANREARIADGWLPLDEGARAKRIKEKEERAEKRARSKLKYIFNDDSVIDEIINENEDLHSAQDVMAMLAKKAPKTYAEMEEAYKKSKLSERKELQEDIAENEARNKLRFCANFKGASDEEFEDLIADTIRKNEEIHNVQDIVSMIRKNSPDDYAKMEEDYATAHRESLRPKTGESQENYTEENDGKKK